MQPSRHPDRRHDPFPFEIFLPFLGGGGGKGLLFPSYPDEGSIPPGAWVVRRRLWDGGTVRD